MSNKFEAMSKYFVLLIDILYAVTIGEGLTRISKELTLPQNTIGFVSIEFLLFVFALVVIFRDWIEYHVAIKERPHRGIKRFALDIIILLVFFFLIRTYKDMEWYLRLLPLFFGATLCWGILERYEWAGTSNVQKEKMKKGMLISTIYFIYFALFPLFLSKIIIKYSCAWDIPGGYLVVVLLYAGFVTVQAVARSNKESTNPRR